MTTIELRSDLRIAHAATIESGEPAGAAALESSVVLGAALSRPRSDGSAAEARATERSARASQDAAMLGRASALLVNISSPEALLLMTQSLVRDLQTTQREEGVRSSLTRSEVQGDLRLAMQEGARAAEESRHKTDEVANVFSAIGVGLALVAGAVSAVFTGGAGLVAAIGLAIAVLGPLVCNILAQEGCVDPLVAAGVGAGLAVVGSCMSFGAGAAAAAPAVAGAVAPAVATAASTAATAASTAAATAATAASTASTVVTTTIQVAQVGSAVAQAVQGGLQIASGVHASDAGYRAASATEADHAVEQSLEQIEEHTAEIRAMTQLFARVARRIAEAVEARGETLRAASGARA